MGAAGGVGHFAVPLAKWKGAHVAGTASGRNHKMLYELGADQVIDYTTHRFEDVAQNIDVVLDTIGGDTQERSWQVLKKGGILVSCSIAVRKQSKRTRCSRHQAGRST